VKRLFVDQRPMLTRDHRQLADWLARGTYPIAVSLREVEFEQIKRDGFPVAPVPQPPDAPGHVSAGFGLVGLMNDAPHPNAARVLQNFLFTAAVQQLIVNDGGLRSVHPDVKEPPGRTPLSEVKTLPDDPAAMLPLVAEIKRRYTAIFGN
jgi:iron(III) transport system substrate-binding protein